jgi:hypothetical protein
MASANIGNIRAKTRPLGPAGDRLAGRLLL